MSWWQAILRALREDFSDLHGAAAATRLILRLAMAGVLGGALGYQRERAGKEAGMRTHMLVAMGAALFALAPEQSGMTGADVSRVIQGLVAGIGFLGAGTIHRQHQGRVEGLTTAAGVWFTAAIGVAAGLGRGATAVLSAALALLVLAAVPRVAARGG